MNNKTLKMWCKVMCLVLIASFALETPLFALETIPVKVGGQVFEVTPGQWVSVRQGTEIVHYNVRYVNGRPVALEMSQYRKLVFGEAVAGPVSDNSGSSQSSGSNSGSSSNSGKTSKPSTNSNSSSGNTGTNPRDNSGSVVSSENSGSTVSNSNSGSSGNSSGGTVRWKDPNTGKFVKAGTPGAVQVGGSSSSSGQTAQSGQTGNAGSVTGADSSTTSPTTNSESAAATTPSSGGKVRWKDPNTGRFVKAGTPGAVQVGGSSTSSGQTAQTGNTGSITGADSSTSPTTNSEAVSNTGTTSTSSTSGGKVRWKDPTTGRFVKAGTPGAVQVGGSSGTTGQAGQSGQSGQGGQTGGDTGTPTTPGDGTQTPGQGDSGQAGQAGQDGEGGFWDKTKGKFVKGYEAGKGTTNTVIDKTKVMAGQGVQNVKDSLKSGFSAKNLLVTAGITVGVDLATQIMRGEKPSAKKALKTVCSAEFVGGVGGSVVGAAAGSFFVPFLTAIPVVGGVLSALAPTFGSIVGGSMGAYVAGDLKNGKFSLRDAWRRIDWVGVAGQTVGSTVGAMLGSALGPVGTVIGGMVGGYIGNWAAHKIAGLFGGGKGQALGETPVAMPIGTSPTRPNNDGIITIGGADTLVGGEASISDSPPLVIGGDDIEIGGSSDLKIAYERYADLFNLYTSYMNAGKVAEAQKVAPEMNKAKKAFDQMKAQTK